MSLLPDDRGPKYRCRNGACDLIRPRTTVHKSDRKTLYRCPSCSRVLGAVWNDDREDQGDVDDDREVIDE